LNRLKDWDDQRSWRDFFDTYWKLIYGVARKAGLTDAEAQDVVQDTVITVAKKIKDLKYDPALGSFKGWLRQITRWRIVDQFRKRLPVRERRQRAFDESQRTDTIERLPDPVGFDLDAVWEADWHKNLMEAALQRVKRKVDAFQYQIFDLYAIKQKPASEVARIQGVSVGQVYLSKHRVGRLLKKETEYLEKKLV
jgi:RNA polymerase sigma-70 factor (ECF subfamily)